MIIARDSKMECSQTKASVNTTGAFIFALGIMYTPMNEGLHLPEIEKAPFLGLSCYLIVIDISNGSL